MKNNYEQGGFSRVSDQGVKKTAEYHLGRANKILNTTTLSPRLEDQERDLAIRSQRAKNYVKMGTIAAVESGSRAIETESKRSCLPILAVGFMGGAGLIAYVATQLIK